MNRFILYIFIFIFSIFLNSVKANQHLKVCNSSKFENFNIAQFEKINSDLVKEDDCNEKLKKENLIKSRYEKNFPKELPRIKENIYGIEIEGTKDELKILKEALCEGDESNLPRVWMEKAKNCKTAVCALGSLYNSELSGMQILSLAKETQSKENPNGIVITASQRYGHRVKQEQLWTSDEINQIVEAIDLLPNDKKNLHKLESIIRMPDGFRIKGEEKASAHAIAKNNFFKIKGEILIYERAFLTPHEFKEVFIHELGHHYDYVNNESEKDAFRGLSGWNQTIKLGRISYNYKNSSSFVTEYSKTDPSEDFAEDFSYYVTNSLWLKLFAKDKYDYIKNNVFNGKEFELKVPESLKAIFDKKGGVEGINQSCIKNLWAIKFLDGSEPFLFSSDTGYNLSYYFNRLDNCYSKIIDEIDLEFKASKDYCESGGRKIIEDYIYRNIMPYLAYELQQDHNHVLENKDKFIEECFKKNQLQNPLCVEKYVVSQNSKLKEYYQRNGYYFFLTNEIVNSMNFDDYLGCIENIQYKIYSESLINYHSYDLGCFSGILNKYFKNQNLKIDETIKFKITEQMLFNEGVSSKLSFFDDVTQKYFKSKKQCNTNDNECMSKNKKLLAEILDASVEKYKIDLNLSEKEKFISLIQAKIDSLKTQ